MVIISCIWDVVIVLCFHGAIGGSTLLALAFPCINGATKVTQHSRGNGHPNFCIKLEQSYVSYHDNFLHLKTTCKGPYKLVSPSYFVITPFGKADLLIIETFQPESKSFQKSLRLLMVPIVSAVQMVMGNSCLGILIFCPW